MPTVTGAAIVADQLRVRFEDGSSVFENLSVTISSNEVVAIVGKSGCGKTTLLRVLAGLQSLHSGGLHFDPPVEPQHGTVGYVFQNAALLPWRSAWQNVALPLELIARGRAAGGVELRRQAYRWLGRVGLAEADYQKKPHQLSGGMQMRVSIARALCTDPTLLLLDEPFAALDDVLRARLGQLLQQLWMQQNRTVVLVTHHIAEAVLNSQRVLVMNEGRIATEVVVDRPYPRPTSIAGDRYLLQRVAQITEILEKADPV